MKMTKKILAVILVVSMIAALGLTMTGCTKDPATPTQNADTTPSSDSTPVPTPTPTASATAAPSADVTPTPSGDPTPTPDSTPAPALYEFSYRIVNDNGDCAALVVVPENVDKKKIKEIIVPSYIDGHKVTVIPYDFMGVRSSWTSNDRGEEVDVPNKGFCVDLLEPDEQGNIWTDPEVWVEKIVFPDTIEVYEGNIFWFASTSLKTIVFEGTENVTYVGRYAFGQTRAEVTLAKANGGFLVINGFLAMAMPSEEVVIPSDVKVITSGVFHGMSQSYNTKVKVIRVNDGCERIEKQFTEKVCTDISGEGGTTGKSKLTDCYIPASVQYMHNGTFWWTHDCNFNLHVVEGSYADWWAKTKGWPKDKLIYDMGAKIENDFEVEIIGGLETGTTVKLVKVNASANKETLEIPEEIYGLKVVQIDANAFADFTNSVVTTVILPEALKNVDRSIFSNLGNVTIE